MPALGSPSSQTQPADTAPAAPLPAYIPGACNIGGAEVRFRKLVAWGCTAATAAAWGACAWWGVAPAWRLLVGLPAAGAALCVLQARAGFCVNYGLLGIANFTDDFRHPQPVEHEEHRRQDRALALRIIGGALLIGAAVGVAAMVLAVVIVV
ncbi:hypothetical protein DB346_00085 [Verrucomicrobia bacterium LW23]|nr:hypothetical protein DB346_00085 [Verrucomicrobia bacterium LW23]